MRRVNVKDGSGEVDLGGGTYIGNVSVFIIAMADGSLHSPKNAEDCPPDDMVPEGAEVIESHDNPKIVLDSGEVKYGCQVWWEYIIPEGYKARVKDELDRLLAQGPGSDEAAFETVKGLITTRGFVKAVVQDMYLNENPIEPPPPKGTE